jgi:phosphoketolase
MCSGGPRHSHGRRTHDRQDGLVRSQPWLPKRKFNVKKKALPPELPHKMDACWHAANYLSVRQIYLYDNPLLKRPLTLADVKRMLLDTCVTENTKGALA